MSLLLHSLAAVEDCLATLGARLRGRSGPDDSPADALESLESALERLASSCRGEQQEQRRLRGALEGAEAQLRDVRSLIEHGPDGYVVTDAMGVIRHANRAASARLGVLPRFMAGKPLALFVAGADLTEFRWRVNHMIEARRAVQWTARLQPRHGEAFEASVTATTFPSGGDSEGPEIRWLIRDLSAASRIAELEAAHEFKAELLASEQRARAAAEAAQRRLGVLAEASRILAGSIEYQTSLAAVGALLVPDVGRLFVVDLLESTGLCQAALLAAPREIGAALAEARARHDVAGGGALARVLETGDPLLLPSLSESWAEAFAGAAAAPLLAELQVTRAMLVPLPGPERVIGVLTVGRTAADRHDDRDLGLVQEIGVRAALAIQNAQLVRELRAEHRRKDEFLALLAHELRNPLAAISNVLHLTDPLGGSDRTRLYGIIRRQADQLTRMVNDLLDVSRIRLNKVDLHARVLDLRDLVRQAVEGRLAAGGTGQLAVTVWTATEPVPVLGDPHRLHQVVFNLLDNAVKFTAPDGAIDVRVERGRTHGVVRVRDSGVGIPASALGTIFEPFVQEQPAARFGEAGLGLGLTVVRDLVHQHGGTVEARSAGPGQGSEFVISLPLGPDPETAVAPPAGAPDAAPDARRVLVIEDNADGRETLRLMLAGHGHVVELAEDGQGGIARALSFRPDVALIDIGLPDVSGHAVARAIRQQPGGDRVYLVALTGFGQPEDRARAQEAGFDAYLVKPVDPGTLTGVLNGRQPSAA